MQPIISFLSRKGVSSHSGAPPVVEGAAENPSAYLGRGPFLPAGSIRPVHRQNMDSKGRKVVVCDNGTGVSPVRCVSKEFQNLSEGTARAIELVMKSASRLKLEGF